VAGPAAGSWAFELGLVGLVLVLGAASARRPRLVALAVSLALGVFVVESATHAVHELRDPGHATHCSVLAAAEHAPSDAPAAPALLDAPAPSPWRAWPSPAPIRIDPAGRAARGRAPPSASV
jgi:hypothetical protein